LDDGYAVVLPPGGGGSAGPTGWWRVDPETGTTIGVLDNGLHGGLDERAGVEVKPLSDKAIAYLKEVAIRNEKRHATKMLLGKIGTGLDFAAAMIMAMIASVFFMAILWILAEALAGPKAPSSGGGGSRG
jgi:hypothetical protein